MIKIKNAKLLIVIMVLGVLSASFAFAQTDASVTPLTPGWGGPNYDQPLWTITYNKAVIPVSFTSYRCTSAALVLEYATWADYTKLDWQTGKTNQYTGFIPASASDLSQKVYITIPNLIPSTSYTFRVGAKCTSSSPIGTLTYTTSANKFSTPATPSSPTQSGDITPPNAPDNLQVNDVTATHVALSWNTPADDVAVTRYELKYKIGGGTFLESDWAMASSLPAPVAPPSGIMGVATFGYNDLTPNTTYILGLKAYDAASNVSPLAVSPSFTTLATPPLTIPIAPTGLTASYSTVPNGPEVQLNVTDNATNETEYRLYWHLSGTAWPSTFQPTGTSTWSFPINVGNIQIAAPGTAGTYEYRVQACNSAGCSSSNIASVNVPAAPTTASGFCIVINNVTSMPSASAPDIGTGYAKISKPGVTTLTGIIDACSSNDFNALMQLYCARNSAQAQTEVWAENTTACGKTGCNYNTCPNNDQANTNTNSNTLTGTSSSGAAAVTPITSPPSEISTSIPTPSTQTPPAAPITTPNNNQTGSVNAINPANQPITQPQTAPSVLSGTKCARYLGTIKSTLDNNERYVKKIKQKMRGAPENYVNFDDVTASLTNADGALNDARDIIKKKECSQPTLESIRDKQGDISNILQNLSAYHTDELQYFRAYAQCKSTLASRTKRINAFVKKEKNKETKSSLQDAISEITQKAQEFAKDASRAFFPEVIYQCKDYVKGLDEDVKFYLRTGKF